MRIPHTSMPLAFAVALAVALVWLPFMTRAAYPHDALPTAAQPLGWKYPYNCCANNDCRAVPSGAAGVVRETATGFVIVKTGEVIAYGDTRIKVSPDQDFHWCSVAGLDDSRTICLFVPNRGF